MSLRSGSIWIPTLTGHGRGGRASTRLSCLARCWLRAHGARRCLRSGEKRPTRRRRSERKRKGRAGGKRPPAQPAKVLYFSRPGKIPMRKVTVKARPEFRNTWSSGEVPVVAKYDEPLMTVGELARATSVMFSALKRLLMPKPTFD